MPVKVWKLTGKSQQSTSKCIEFAQYSTKVHTADGVKKDIKEQFKYLKMAADKENLEASFSFAVMLDYGLEIEMNKKEAAKYYKIAADKGLVPAMTRYAEMAEKGEGIKKKQIVTKKRQPIKKTLEQWKP